MNAIQIKLSFWVMSETNSTPIMVSGQAYQSMQCTCLPVRSLISHLLPDPDFNQYQCSFYLSHCISPFLMVPLKPSSSSYLSISGWGQLGLTVIVSPQKHSALSRIEISESMFGVLFLLL